MQTSLKNSPLPFPGLADFDLKAWLFEKSCAVENRHTPTLEDGLHALESDAGDELLGLNHIAAQPGFAQTVNEIAAMVKRNDQVIDPALLMVHQALLRVLSNSWYSRGPDGRVWRESILVAPMVVFYRQASAEELLFDPDPFIERLSQGGRTARALQGDIGGVVRFLGPMLGGGICTDLKDEPDARAVLSTFGFDFEVARHAFAHDEITLEPRAAGVYKILEKGEKPEICYVEGGGFVTFRAQVLGLPMVHALPAGEGSEFTMVTDRPALDSPAILEAMRADAPLEMTAQCDALMLSPSPLSDSLLRMLSLRKAIASLQDVYVPLSRSSDLTGYRTKRHAGDPPWLACGIRMAGERPEVPVFRGSKHQLDFIEALFEKMCAASDVEIRDVEYEE